MTELTCSAVVFDCDGTLIDSERVWLDLMARLLEERHLRVEDVGSLRGITAAEAAERLAVATSSRRDECEEEIGRRYSTALASITEPMPGVLELLTALDGVIPIAVATNGCRVDVEAMLGRVGVTKHVPHMFTIDDVECGKPEPDLYINACAAMGHSPETVVAFEDSAVGARAAFAAGCRVVGLGPDVPSELIVARAASLAAVGFDAARRTFTL